MSAISTDASACLQSFIALGIYLQQATSEFQSLIPPLALEDEVGRFKVWMDNLGVFKEGHSSLDYRLRESPLMRTNVLKLLEELSSTLRQTTEIVSCKRLPYEKQIYENVDDDESSSSSHESDGAESKNMVKERPMTELQQRLLAVSQIIDYLYKLSTKIRDQNLRLESFRAPLLQHAEKETEFELLPRYAIFDGPYTEKENEDELLSQYTISDRAYTCEMFNEFRGESLKYEEDSFLIDRLSRAITKRRQKFMHWKKHRTKLPSGTANVSFEVAPVQSDQDQADNGAMDERLQSQELVPVNVKDVHRSEDDAMEIIMYLDNADSVSEVSGTTSVVDMKGEKVALPPPPNIFSGKDFKCPYCFTVCPFRYSEPHAWRAHLLRDLQPYLCTYPHCPEPDRLYSDRLEWLNHEHFTHRHRWRCPWHYEIDFISKTEFELHLHELHAGMTIEQQLIYKAEFTSGDDVRRSCPVCLQKINADCGLHNHLAKHLERLAVFALPKDSGLAGKDISEITSDSATGYKSNLSQSSKQSFSFHLPISHQEGDSIPHIEPSYDVETDRLQEWMEVKERSSETEHPDTLSAKHDSVTRSNDLMPTQESIELGEKVLDASQRMLKLKYPEILKSENPDTFGATKDLAISYGNLVSTQKDMRLGELLEVSQRILGHKHPIHLWAITVFTNNYRDLELTQETVKLQEISLETSKQTLGSEHRDTLMTMTDLAASYSDLGRRQEAMELREKVLEVRKRTLGNRDPEILMAMASLAESCSDLGRPYEAMKLRRKVLEASKRTIRSRHPYLRKIETNLVTSYSNFERIQKEVELREEALEASEKAFGSEHPDTLVAMSYLAVSYSNLGFRQDATELREMVLEVSKRTLKNEDARTILAMAYLADSYNDLGRKKEARSLRDQVWIEGSKRAMELREKALEASKGTRGSEHPDTLLALTELAINYRDLGRRQEAMELREQILEGSKKTLGDEDPETLMAMAYLADSCSDLGRTHKAMKLRQRVLWTSKWTWGIGHPNTLMAMTDLADSYNDLGRGQEATELRDQVLGVERKYMDEKQLFGIKIESVPMVGIEERQRARSAPPNIIDT